MSLCRALFGLGGALLVAGCSRPPAQELTTEAYVWQRVRTPAVESAIERAAPFVDGFFPQVAEVSFGDGEPRVAPCEVAWETLARSRRPVGAVIRVPAVEGGLGTESGQVETIARVMADTAEAARRAGTTLTEVQIDYDCPESKLDGYARFLRALRAARPELPVVFTALPAWLGQPGFRALAGAADGFVLQVHSLELPRKQDAAAVICDVDAARAAITAASRLGRAFRVALPTYQCIVWVDREGRRLAVTSEGEAPRLPGDARAIPGAADPRALAALVADLRARPARGLTGMIWYRLPVDTDRMNWAWPTFAAVAAGRMPNSRREVTLDAKPGGATVVTIRNAGEISEPLPAEIVATWTGGTLEAADGLGGYRAAPTEAGACRFQLDRPPLFGLPPGATVTAGWLRVRHAAGMHVSTPRP